jgi:shikimate kinase
MRIKPAAQPGSAGQMLESQQLRMGAVFLVGFMGAGKSSVGRVLAHKLAWIFADVDERIQTREGRTITQIFEEAGEGGFRTIETAVLKEVLSELSLSPRVIALGGGAFVQPENIALLREVGGHTVYLHAPVEELFRRCREQQIERPLQRNFEQFRALHERRRPYYLKAEWHIDTSGKNIQTVAAELAQTLGLHKNRTALKER